MSHNHSHHDQTQLTFNTEFKIGITLNLAYVVIEFLFGIFYNSLALIADAGHNLSDVFGLLIAWGASYLVTRKPSETFTYGFKRSSIIAATINSLILLVALGIILWEAIQRLSMPVEVPGKTIIIVAGIGVVINGITAFLFLKGKEDDLNIKGAYLHMLADALISVGVVFAGIVIHFTSFYLLDALISMIIVIIIFWGTWGLLRDALKLSLDAVPASIKIKEVSNFLLEIPGISAIHHLHVWALSTTENALTVHIVKKTEIQNDELLRNVNDKLKHEFNISHTTIQIEESECEENC